MCFDQDGVPWYHTQFLLGGALHALGGTKLLDVALQQAVLVLGLGGLGAEVGDLVRHLVLRPAQRAQRHRGKHQHHPQGDLYPGISLEQNDLRLSDPELLLCHESHLRETAGAPGSHSTIL